MAVEKKYQAIDPVALSIDGQANGIVTVVDTACFKVKMAVVLEADTLGTKRFQVKRVIDSTQMILGPEGKSLHHKSDLSAYVLGLNPIIFAPEQDRPNIPPADYERAVFEEEPTLAKRVFQVDKYGKPYTEDNPFPVDAIFNIDTIEFNNPNNHDFKLLPIPTKNTEVSYTFPTKLKYYQIKARDCKDVIKVGLSAGAIAAGDYWEIAYGNFFHPEELMDFPDGYTLYFESKHIDNVDLEIFYYRRL